MKITIEDIKVNVKLTDNPEATEKAIVTLSIDSFKIKGFRILPSEHINKHGEKLWIAPPSYKSRSGRWHREFHCEDKKLWEAIEDKVFEEYKRKKEEIPVIEENGKGGYIIKKDDINPPPRP